MERNRLIPLVGLAVATAAVVVAIQRYEPIVREVRSIDLPVEQAVALREDILITEEEFALGRALYADEAIAIRLPDPLPPEGKVLEKTDYAVFDTAFYEDMILDALDLREDFTVLEVGAIGDSIHVQLISNDKLEMFIYDFTPDGQALKVIAECKKYENTATLCLENQNNEIFHYIG